MADSTAEHAEVVVETALPFCVRELSILPELVGEGGGMSGRGRRGFLVGFLVMNRKLFKVQIPANSTIFSPEPPRTIMSSF